MSIAKGAITASRKIRHFSALNIAARTYPFVNLRAECTSIAQAVPCAAVANFLTACHLTPRPKQRPAVSIRIATVQILQSTVLVGAKNTAGGARGASDQCDNVGGLAFDNAR